MNKYKIILFISGLLILFLFVANVSAINLIVNSPVQGSIYDSDRRVDFNLESSEPGDFYIVKKLPLDNDRTNTPRWMRICRQTTHCEKSIRLIEGNNRVLVKVINDQGESDVSDPISFFIDTIEPRVLKTSPRKKSITNGDNFYVQYNEYNLKRITLYYGKGLTRENMTKDNTECDSGRREKCSFNPDLSMFDSEEIDYWFEIEDLAGNIVESKINEVMVDTTDPVVRHKEYWLDRRRVNFLIDIEETNFENVMYLDKEERRPRWRRLCSRLNIGICDAKKSFRKGEHLLDIKVTDKAGNSVMVYDNLQITI